MTFLWWVVNWKCIWPFSKWIFLKDNFPIDVVLSSAIIDSLFSFFGWMKEDQSVTIFLRNIELMMVLIRRKTKGTFLMKICAKNAIFPAETHKRKIKGMRYVTFAWNLRRFLKTSPKSQRKSILTLFSSSTSRIQLYDPPKNQNWSNYPQNYKKKL